MTKIVGHRGAAGLALENTIPSFQAAIQAGVDAIEFDVHATKDGELVICHDDDLSDVSDSRAVIRELTFEELRKIPLRNGEPVPTLREVLELAASSNTAVVVEIKVKGYTTQICNVVDEYPELAVTYASFERGVVQECRELRPDTPALVANKGHHPFEIVEIAKREHATGIDINFRALNPLTYWLCKRANLQIMAYTVNSRLIGKFIQRLYPDVWICTNYPNKFIQRTRRARGIRPQRRTD